MSDNAVVTGINTGCIVRQDDGSLHVVVWGTGAWHRTNHTELITIHEQTDLPRWIKLKCGHFASNPGLGIQHGELLLVAKPHELVSARCSLCDSIIFEQAPVSHIEYNGLNGYVSQKSHT